MLIVMLIAGIVTALVATLVITPAGDRNIDNAMDPVIEKFVNGDIETPRYIAETGAKGCGAVLTNIVLAVIVLGVVLFGTIALLMGA